MKTCKYCKEDIASDASKCPKCQSFQAWYGNYFFMIIFPLIFMLPMLLYLMSFGRYEKADFETYKNEVTIKFLSQDTIMIKEEPKINILVEIDNPTDKKWKTPNYEIAYLSESKALLNVEQVSDYRLIVPPNAKTKSSIKTRLYKEYQNAKIEVRLINLSHERY